MKPRMWKNLSVPAVSLLAVATAVGSSVLLPAQAAEPHHSGPDYVVHPEGKTLQRATDRIAEGVTSSGERASANAQAAAVNRYDVHVFAVNTEVGPHKTSRAESQRVVKRLDAEYNRETRGAYRFQFGSYRNLNVPTAYCGVEDWERRLQTRIAGLQAKEGSADALWVVVSDGWCDFAGQAWIGSAGTHMLADYWRADGAQQEDLLNGPEYGSQTDVRTLAHEIGHNLGLEHPWGQDPHSGARFPGQVTEYHSPASVMGENHHTVRFSPMELAQLGVADPSRTVAALERDETFEIVPMRSASGVSTIVVPAGDTSHAVISYRDGVGPDWHMRHGTTSPYGPECGEDVEAALCTSDLKAQLAQAVRNNESGEELWVRRDNVGVVVEALVQARTATREPRISALVTARPPGAGVYFNERQAFVAGESVDLTAGVKVDVLAVSATGATVRVRRPADTKVPAFGTYDNEYPCHMYTGGASDTPYCTVTGNKSASAIAYLWVTNAAWDDTAIVAAGFDVNGRTVARRDWTLDRPRWMQHDGEFNAPVRLKAGTHEVTRWIRDVAGKTTIKTSTITVKPDPFPGTVRSLAASKVQRTSARLTWREPKWVATGVKDYVVQVSWRDARGVKRTRTVADGVRAATGATVKRLKPGTAYTVSVRAKTAKRTSKAVRVKVTTKR